MPTFDVPKNYQDGSPLTETILDSAFEYIEGALNSTKLDSVNIQSGGITADNLAAGSVTTDKLDSAAVTTAKITDANVTTAKLADASVTQSKLATLPQTISSSSGSVSSSSTTFAQITNHTAAITTTGRPVIVMFMPEAGTSNAAGVLVGSGSDGYIRFKRGATVITTFNVTNNQAAGTIAHAPGGFSFIDTGASAGTTTYTAEYRVGTTGSISVQYISLAAWEL
jgi:hypothetical protein